MKLYSFISRLQVLNAYLEEFPPDTEGQETAPLSADETMDIIYHSTPTTWKKKMIEQGFNYANSTVKEMSDDIRTRVENLVSSCQEKPQESQEEEKGRLRLQCCRVQHRIYLSLPSNKEIL